MTGSMIDPTIVPIISAVIPAALGGGGIAAYLNYRNAKRLGVQQEDRADDDALNARAMQLLQAQFDLFVKPLQEEVAKLRTRVDSMEDELREERSKYRRLVTYLRELRGWVTRNVPNAPTGDPIPDAPQDILNDL